jgi:hypothetical protein
MKNKNDLLKADQIEKYLKIANELSVPKMVTISNQFVSTQTQSPVNLKAPKSVGMYHLSWSYILTIAHVLLIKNDMNIKDEDQANIMREVVAYFENSASGVCGFHQMKAGWAKTVDKINSNMVIKANDPDLSEAVLSWQQEEKDMALILSRKLGVLVGTGYPKYKNDLIGRYKDDAKKLLTDKMLNSLLRVKGACSDLTVKAFFDRRIVEISITLEAPKDKKVKGQIGWLRKQLEQGQKKNPNSYERIKDDLFMEAVVKFSRQDERMPTSRTDELCDHLKGKEVVTLNVVYVKDFGKGFSSSKKFVKIIETMLVDFYRGVVQNITKWKPPTPKIQQRVTVVSNEDSSGDELCNNEDSNN